VRQGIITPTAEDFTIDRPALWWRAGAKALPPVATLLLFLLLWEVGARLANLPTYLIPKPSEIYGAIVENRQELVGATFRTATASLTGLGLAIVLGVTVAIVLGLSNVLERTFFPYAVVLQIIPIVTIAPLIVIWIGPGLNSIVAISLIISFFPILSNTLAGLQSVDPETRSLFSLFGASRMEVMRKLRLPGSMPYIMAGVRISAGLSIKGAILGEFIAGGGGGEGGLGYIVSITAADLQTPYLLAAALASAFLGITYYFGGKVVTSRILAWHESTLVQESAKGGVRSVAAIAQARSGSPRAA
jgi:NitT/TauT family transport system permease protein